MAKWTNNTISASAGAPAAAGKPSGFTWEGDHTMHVVYRGSDNQIHELWFKRGLFNAEWKYGGPLTAQAGAPPATGNPSGFSWESDKSQHVSYRGVDNQIHEVWFKHGLVTNQWKHTPVGAEAGAPPAAGDPMGFVWDEDKTQHIVYRGTDNNIHEVWFKHGVVTNRWTYGGALNAKVGAPPAKGNPAGFSWEHDKTMHIIYTGVDGNIHELWFKKGLMGANWMYGGAINAKVGAPQAAGDPMGYTWEDDNTQHIVYRGVDGKIHELWFKKNLVSAKWEYGGAISDKTGAPFAAGDPWGFAWEGDHTMHVIYRTTDNQIGELWFKKDLFQAAWKYGGALNGLAGGPTAASEPEGYVWEDDHSQHAIYLGTDNQIHELWFKK